MEYEGIELQELIGSEKQVKWANDLRIKFLESIKTLDDDTLPCYANDYTSWLKSLEVVSKRYGEISEVKKIVMETLAKKGSSKYWIDNRLNNPIYLFFLTLVEISKIN